MVGWPYGVWVEGSAKNSRRVCDAGDDVAALPPADVRFSSSDRSDRRGRPCDGGGHHRPGLADIPCRSVRGRLRSRWSDVSVRFGVGSVSVRLVSCSNITITI